MNAKTTLVKMEVPVKTPSPTIFANNPGATSRVELHHCVSRSTSRTRSSGPFGRIGGRGQILPWRVGCFKGWNMSNREKFRGKQYWKVAEKKYILKET